MHYILELVGAQEHNYHFHPHTVMNGDVLISMSVESDGQWVDRMVANDVPRFCFWGSSDSADLMGEDRNNIINPEYNNAEYILLEVFLVWPVFTNMIILCFGFVLSERRNCGD